MDSQCVKCKHYKVIPIPLGIEPNLKDYEKVIPWMRDCRIDAHVEYEITEEKLCPKFEGKEAEK